MFTEFKDLNLLKKYTKNQEASNIFRIGFALSKRPHLFRAYLVTVSFPSFIAVHYNKTKEDFSLETRH